MQASRNQHCAGLREAIDLHCEEFVYQAAEILPSLHRLERDLIKLISKLCRDCCKRVDIPLEIGSDDIGNA